MGARLIPQSDQCCAVHHTGSMTLRRVSLRIKTVNWTLRGLLHPASFDDLSRQEVGDIVLAMGNPLRLASNVTNGVISTAGRTVAEPGTADSPRATLTDCLQISAEIDPGTSESALVGYRASY